MQAVPSQKLRNNTVERGKRSGSCDLYPTISTIPSGSKFRLRTNHSLLKWLQTFKEPEGEMARWLEVLQEYHFDIVHCAGIKH